MRGAASGRGIVDATGAPSRAAKELPSRSTPAQSEQQNAAGDAAGAPCSAAAQGACQPASPASGTSEQSGSQDRSNEGRRRGRRRRRRNQQPAEGPVYGALDLGTNNCRLLVACPSAEGFRVIDAFSRIVRLGEGASASGKLSEPAMGRTIEALKVCTGKMARRNVTRFRLIATEACRTAENGAEFIDRVHQTTGLRLEVVDRETEARLAVAGSASLIAPDCGRSLVFDIGGGSTELMLLENADGDHQLHDWTSLPVGVVTLAERHGGVEVGRATFDGMMEDVRPAISDFLNRAAFPVEEGLGCHMLGTSGTVTTIAGVHQNLRRYDRSKVDGSWISRGDINGVTDRLLAMTYEQRADNPCIGPDRADLVLAGCAILCTMLQQWPCERVRVADRGLREGILTELMTEDGTFGRGPRSRRRRSRGLYGGARAPRTDAANR